MEKLYVLSGTSAFEIRTSLQGGHSLFASLWYDEFGPGWWNIAGAGAFSDFAWSIGPLNGLWQAKVRSQHDYDADLPFVDKTFKAKKGTTEFEFWLDLRAASNTGQSANFIVDLTVTQNQAVVPPEDGVPHLLLKPGVVSVDNYVKLIFQT